MITNTTQANELGVKDLCVFQKNKPLPIKRIQHSPDNKMLPGLCFHREIDIQSIHGNPTL